MAPLTTISNTEFYKDKIDTSTTSLFKATDKIRRDVVDAYWESSLISCKTFINRQSMDLDSCVFDNTIQYAVAIMFGHSKDSHGIGGIVKLADKAFNANTLNWKTIRALIAEESGYNPMAAAPLANGISHCGLGQQRFESFIGIASYQNDIIKGICPPYKEDNRYRDFVMMDSKNKFPYDFPYKWWFSNNLWQGGGWQNIFCKDPNFPSNLLIEEEKTKRIEDLGRRLIFTYATKYDQIMSAVSHVRTAFNHVIHKENGYNNKIDSSVKEQDRIAILFCMAILYYGNAASATGLLKCIKDYSLHSYDDLLKVLCLIQSHIFYKDKMPSFGRPDRDILPGASSPSDVYGTDGDRIYSSGDALTRTFTDGSTLGQSTSREVISALIKITYIIDRDRKFLGTPFVLANDAAQTSLIDMFGIKEHLKSQHVLGEKWFAADGIWRNTFNGIFAPANVPAFTDVRCIT